MEAIHFLMYSVHIWGQVISEFMHSNDNRIELLQRRLHSCSFLVNIEEMSYIDEALQCP
ncbi:T3SS effector NleG family protein, partial [Escherichia coli]|nr:DUF1076 domain-containing protein [Escherichia coli]